MLWLIRFEKKTFLNNYILISYRYQQKVCKISCEIVGVWELICDSIRIRKNVWNRTARDGSFFNISSTHKKKHINHIKYCKYASLIYCLFLLWPLTNYSIFLPQNRLITQWLQRLLWLAFLMKSKVNYIFNLRILIFSCNLITNQTRNHSYCWILDQFGSRCWFIT